MNASGAPDRLFPKNDFRSSMTWLHSWAGIIPIVLFFAIFWMGTLSVFDKEIDRWMQPESRASGAASDIDIDMAIDYHVAAHEAVGVDSLFILVPTQREPYLYFYSGLKGTLDGKGHAIERVMNDGSRALGDPSSLGGSGFIFPFHYKLHIPGNFGYYLVGACALAMMVLCTTGVVAHRKIFADFFTFRPKRKLKRATLDLHNLMGIIGLPFYFLFALSGLYIFAGWFAALPLEPLSAFTSKDPAGFVELADAENGFYRDRADIPAKTRARITPYISKAEDIWSKRYNAPAQADRIEISHYGDANAFVTISRVFPASRVNMAQDQVVFDYDTGTVLLDKKATPARTVRSWMEGFHFVQFAHWPLRWLYFAGGLAGCVLSATGALFWMRSREKKSGLQPRNIRFVHAMTVGSVTGMIFATGVFFVSNRLIDIGLRVPGVMPIDLEPILFFAAWALSFVHAGLRGAPAWRDQLFCIAALSLLAVVLNWVTTGDHLAKTFAEAHWAIAGMDMMLLLCSGISLWAAAHLLQKSTTVRPGAPSQMPAQ